MIKHDKLDSRLFPANAYGRLEEFLNSDSTKRDAKPDSSHELYTDDRDSMIAEQAVDTDAEGFDGDPIEDDIKSENPFYCSKAYAAFYNALDPGIHGCEMQCDKCKKVKDL